MQRTEGSSVTTHRGRSRLVFGLGLELVTYHGYIWAIPEVVQPYY